MSERCCTRTYDKGFKDGYYKGAKNWWNMFTVAHNPHFGNIDTPAYAWIETFYCLEWHYMGNVRSSYNETV